MKQKQKMDENYFEIELRNDQVQVLNGILSSILLPKHPINFPAKIKPTLTSYDKALNLQQQQNRDEMVWKMFIQINPKEVKIQLKTRTSGKMNNIITAEYEKRDLFDATSIETSMLCYELLLDSASVGVQANPEHVTSNISLLHTQTHQLQCHVDGEDYSILFNKDTKRHEWILKRTFIQKLEDHTNVILGKPTAREKRAQDEERKRDRQERRETLDLQRSRYELEEEKR